MNQPMPMIIHELIRMNKKIHISCEMGQKIEIKELSHLSSWL